MPSTEKLRLSRPRRRKTAQDPKKNIEMKILMQEHGDRCCAENGKAHTNDVLGMLHLCDKNLDDQSPTSENEFEQISLASSVHISDSAFDQRGSQHKEFQRLFGRLKATCGKIHLPSLTMQYDFLKSSPCFDVCIDSDDDLSTE